MKELLYNKLTLNKTEKQMDNMTTTDYQIVDDWETRHEANKDDARNAFYQEVSKIQQRFEHLINHDYSTLSVNDAQEVGSCLDKMDDLAFLYSYDCEEGEFEYDFRHELKVIKSDELGMEV